MVEWLAVQEHTVHVEYHRVEASHQHAVGVRHVRAQNTQRTTSSGVTRSPTTRPAGCTTLYSQIGGHVVYDRPGSESQVPQECWGRRRLLALRLRSSRMLFTSHDAPTRYALGVFRDGMTPDGALV